MVERCGLIRVLQVAVDIGPRHDVWVGEQRKANRGGTRSDMRHSKERETSVEAASRVFEVASHRSLAHCWQDTLACLYAGQAQDQQAASCASFPGRQRS